MCPWRVNTSPPLSCPTSSRVWADSLWLLPLSLEPRQAEHSSSFCRDLINPLILPFQLQSASLTVPRPPTPYFEITLFRRYVIMPLALVGSAGAASEPASSVLSAGRPGWQGGQASFEGRSPCPLQSLPWKTLSTPWPTPHRWKGLCGGTVWC